MACWPMRSTRFRKYASDFREGHSLTVVAPIRAARVSKRCRDTSANFRNEILSSLWGSSLLWNAAAGTS